MLKRFSILTLSFMAFTAASVNAAEPTIWVQAAECNQADTYTEKLPHKVEIYIDFTALDVGQRGDNALADKWFSGLIAIEQKKSGDGSDTLKFIETTMVRFVSNTSYVAKSPKFELTFGVDGTIGTLTKWYGRSPKPFKYNCGAPQESTNK